MNSKLQRDFKNPACQKPQLQKDREDEKAEGYVPDEGTRKNPRKTTK